MTLPLNSRLLAGVNSSSDSVNNVDSDFVVILAALLCALICVLGLVAVARCAWIRRISRSSPLPPAPPSANKGLKKKVLNSLPKLTYSPHHHAHNGNFSLDCAICLAEFVAGDQIRVLPQCGHGFHVGCVDTWLRSRSSCPSCRVQILVTAATTRCQKCGELPSASSSPASVGTPTTTTTATTTTTTTPRVEDQINRFLP